MTETGQQSPSTGMGLPALGGAPLLPELSPNRARGGLFVDVGRALLRDRTGRIGALIVIALLVVAVLGPVVAPHDPLTVSSARFAPPSLHHLLGTDELGRDLLSRLIYGSRISLGLAIIVAASVLTIAVVMGSVAGFFGGLVDTAIMRLVDVVLAFPGLILALAITGLLQPGILPVMLAIVSVSWVGYARIIRGMVLSVRQREFVDGARALGAGNLRLIRRHVLPHVIPPVIVLLSLDMGGIIMATAALSYLGLGAQPPTPEWGAMLNEGRVSFLSDPWLTVLPGLAITLAVLGFNLLGDSIRDAVDPRLR